LEDNEKEIEDNVPEEGPVKIPSTDQMASLDNWVHHTQNILKNGRITHQEYEVPEGLNIEPEVY